MRKDELYHNAVQLLERLIATPSFSREESATADILAEALGPAGAVSRRTGNNVWTVNRHFNPSLPSILLNSHHDTVRPNPGYTGDAFLPIKEDGKLFGLGSNDAGGCLVSLLAAFMYYHDSEGLPYNLVFGASAEEEISGTGGIEQLLKDLPPIACAIVGEPTQMDLAVAEKGLLVLDVITTGKAGHAAREEGDNALYKAIDDINWFRNFHFPRESDVLGRVKMSVTVISTPGKAHNVVPATCSFVVDVRVPDSYTHEEILDEVKRSIKGEVNARSMRMRSTRIASDHPLVRAALPGGGKVYGSPTCSDKALMPFPALKCGPGDSARSHTADEFIFLEEIRKGIDSYIETLGRFFDNASSPK